MEEVSRWLHFCKDPHRDFWLENVSRAWGSESTSDPLVHKFLTLTFWCPAFCVLRPVCKLKIKDPASSTLPGSGEPSKEKRKPGKHGAVLVSPKNCVSKDRGLWGPSSPTYWLRNLGKVPPQPQFPHL